MTALVRLYIQQFKITLATFLQYRAAIFIWTIAHVLEPVIYLVVWSVVARSRPGGVAGHGEADFAAYFIVLMVVNHLTYTWIFYEFEYRIRHGSLSMALLRPVHPIHSDIVDNLTAKIITLPMMLLAAAALALLFRPTFHVQPWALAALLPALALAYLLRFLIEWSLALVAFWTTRVSAINQGYFVAVLFLSGQVAPLELFPRPVRLVAAALPFRWCVAFPVELALGRLGPEAAFAGLAAQAAWLAASLMLMRVVWRAGLRTFSAVGG